MLQEQLVALLGVTRRTVSGWENGRSYPDAAHRAAIAALSGEMAELVTLIPERRSVPVEEETLRTILDRLGTIERRLNALQAEVDQRLGPDPYRGNLRSGAGDPQSGRAGG